MDDNLIKVKCDSCGGVLEYENVYRGCLRPCKKCGKSLFVGNSGEILNKTDPWDICKCGKIREDMKSGIFYEVVSIYYTKGNYKYSCLLLLFFPLLIALLLYSLSRQYKVSIWGWACPQCCRSIRRCHWWTWARLPVIIGMFLSVIITAVIIRNFMHNPPSVQYDASQLGVTILCVLLLSIVPGLIVHRIIMRLLCRSWRKWLKTGPIYFISLKQPPQAGDSSTELSIQKSSQPVAQRDAEDGAR